MGSSFFAGLIQNIALLLVFSYIYEFRWIDSLHSRRIFPKFFAGIIVGAIGIFLMFTPWIYAPGIVFDTRSILLAIAGLYLGLYPTLIAIFITAVFRYYMGGDGMLMGIAVIVFSGLIGISWNYVLKWFKAKKTFLWLYLLGILVHVVMLACTQLLPQEQSLSTFKSIALPVIIIYPLSTVLLGLLMNKHLANWQNRKVKEELLATRQRFRDMLLDINMIFISLNNDGNITSCNNYLLNVTGYTKEEVIGKNWFDLFLPEENRAYLKEAFKTVLREKAPWLHHEGKIITKNGNELIFSWYNNVVEDVDGKVSGTVSLGENITEKQRTIEELKKAKDSAEESNRLKTVFLQNISHEIRTPMNGILGFLGFLKETPVDEKTREKYFDIMQQSGERLLTTVNALIDISKIETKQITVKQDKVNLSKLLAHHVSVYETQLKEKDIQFICTSEYLDSDIILLTDKYLFESIIANLLSNAVKFTKQGIIELGSYTLKEKITFFVKDTGSGIPQDRMAAIFDRFVQADLKISRPHEGTGLGLTIAKAYTELLGGELWVESELGKGSIFYFNLPDNTTKIETAERSMKKTAVNISNRKCKVLVAEDDEVSYLYLKNILKSAGLNTVHARNGDEAVECVRTDSDICMVLMDIKMPVMSGEEATAEIRKFNPDIPIIAQTAYAMADDKNKFLSVGCNDYISKPIQKEEMLRLIEKYLSPSK
ncbi:LytS/YhcK type 5TM receptor domain-containing protein [uncultured Draconibacterium sp.]|uniref:LytS/YhcK type 5TM receptor domain-containing protein n=1 Tax=uncultured Draconibacterium sp. TaxID=1573823 RepID=UPI002AA7F1CB|nr:LytS/YhcK type 5TM receptor domain-containing protein [uncultured Draconibacterium sp.]